MKMVIIQLVEDLNRTKRQRGQVNLLYAWTWTSIFSCPWTSVVLDLGPSDLDKTYTICSPRSLAFEFELELYHQLSWASNLQIASWRTSQPLQWYEPILHNKSLYIFQYISISSVSLRTSITVLQLSTLYLNFKIYPNTRFSSGVIKMFRAR